MRAFLRWAALVAAVALITGAAVHAQTIGGDGTKAQSLGFTRIGGITAADSIGRILKMDASGNAKVVEASKDRDLDYYATLINAAALDTAKDVCVAYSGVVDVRAFSSANLIVHVIPTSADTAGNTITTYDFGITVFPLPTQSYDWTGYGVPMSPNESFAQDVSLYGMAGVVDSLGFWKTPGTSPLLTIPGEVKVRLKNYYGTRTSGWYRYSPINMGRTVSYPLRYFLAPGARPRFVGVQVRAIARSGAAPTVRVDIEALR